MLQASFSEENIDARVFFYPLSSLPMYDNNTKNHYAIDIASRAINLPSYHEISGAEQNRVINVIKRILNV